MSEKELKPCPFCGGKSELWESKASNGYLFGKTVFLTREEAERALKERENNELRI